MHFVVVHNLENFKRIFMNFSKQQKSTSYIKLCIMYITVLTVRMN